MRCVMIVAALVLASACGPYASAQDIEAVSTAQPDVLITKSRGYDQVRLKGPGTGTSGNPATPLLPFRDVLVLLPAGGKASGVQVEVLESSDVAGTYAVEPAGQPDQVQGVLVPTSPDATAYSSKSGVRPDAAVLLRTDVIRGYSLARVRLFPLDYIPAEQRLVLRRTIRFNIEPESDHAVLSSFSATAPRYRRPAPVFDALVRDLVINPPKDKGASLGYAASSARVDPTATPVEYLLIGPAFMFEEFQPLLDWKTKKGVPAEAVDIAWILANYQGDTPQKKLKQCIKDYAENRGTVYVALAGDDTILPTQLCTQLGTNPTPTPCDLYYAALDDMEWDDRPDGDIGNINTGDTVDLGPDVFLGRLPVRTEADAAAIANKAIAYEKNSPAIGFAENLLMVGNAVVEYGDDETACERMYATCIDPFWEPVRYRLYDSATDFPGGAEYAADGPHLTDQLSAGYNFVTELSHGKSSAWSLEGVGLTSEDAGWLVHPDRYANVATGACSTNDFTSGYDPCLSEAFLRNPVGGAVTYIGASAENYNPLDYPGAFYRNLFTGQPAGHAQKVGAVFAASKFQVLDLCAHYAFNLMGDPELPLYTQNPSTMAPLFTSTCGMGSQAFAVNTGVTGARVTFYKPGEVYVRGTADSTGRYEANISPASAGTLFVTVTSLNRYPYEGTVTVQAGRAGRVSIVEDTCRDGTILHIKLADTDLAGTGGCLVQLTTLHGDSETLQLAEVGGQPGYFEGAVSVRSGPVETGDGIIEILAGDTVFATYEESDDGTGNPAINQDSATVDQTGLVISNVAVSELTGEGAMVTFQTDNLATAELCYGPNCVERSTKIVASPGLKTSHAVRVSGLTNASACFFSIRAVDADGDETVDDNSGNCYQFTVRAPLRVPSQHATIQAAVNAAVTGDVVLVAPGVYTGYTLIGKPLTVLGEAGAEETIIDGQGTNMGFGPCNSKITVQGLSFVNCRHGINGAAAVLEIRDCTFSRNEAAVASLNMAGLHIANSVFSENGSAIWYTAETNSMGAVLNLTNLAVENCLFVKNTNSGAGGGEAGIYMRLLVGDRPRITGCTFYGNVSPVGSSVYSGSASNTPITIANCILWDSGTELGGEGAFNVRNCNVRRLWTGGSGNTSVDPKFIAPGDYHLALDSPCIDTGASVDLAKDLDGNPRPSDGDADGLAIHDMGAYEYDPTSPSIGVPLQVDLYGLQGDPAATHAIIITNPGGQPVSWQISDMANWLSICPTSGTCAGGASRQTTLTADLSGLSPGKYPCWMTVAQTAPGTISRTIPVYLHVGRKLNVPALYATIQAAVNAAVSGDMVVLAPRTYTGSGNVNVNLLGKEITIEGRGTATIDCQSTARAFLMQTMENERTVVKGLIIKNGFAADGSAIRILRGSPRIQDCVIHHCTANGENGGAIYAQQGAPLLINSVLHGNTGELAGGVCMDFAFGKIVNCTFTGNSGNSGSGAMAFLNLGAPEVSNCILWGDTGTWPEVALGDGTSLSIHHSNVQGGQSALGAFGSVEWGPGDIDLEPSFVNPTASDYRLAPDSPCVDAGVASALPADVVTDLDGLSRFGRASCGGVGSDRSPVDMGAYEFNGAVQSVVAADFNSDCMVDNVDVSAFAACLGGASVPVLPGCTGKDLDHDSDVDQSDFAILQKCLSGWGIPAPIGCDD